MIKLMSSSTGVVSSPISEHTLCDYCEEPETVKHYLLDCLKYQHLQENLNDFAIKNSVKFTIESILKNEVSTQPS